MPGQSPKRGAIPTPRSALAAATPYRVRAGAPPSLIMNPEKISYWGNDHLGTCVTAEEAFAKACTNPEIYISDDDAIAWATKHGAVNGAYLTDVMTWMQNDGFADGTSAYDDGAYLAVNWTDSAALHSAIAEGPIKLGVVSEQIEPSWDAGGRKSGWFGTGWREDMNAIEDHCVTLCGYGSLSWLAGQLGVEVPDGVDGRKPGYAMFTWSTIGIVDVPSMVAVTQEAWLRQPTTVTKPAPAWRTQDLTAVTRAPVAGGRPATYVFGDNNGSQHVVFRGADNHIHELWFDTSWHTHDLTAITHAPAAAGDPAGYVFEDDRTQHVMFRGADNHIHELWDDPTHGWRTQDLTAITHAPAAVGDPTGYVFEDIGTQHVMYRSADNHIHELWLDDGGSRWQTRDLIAITHAPAAVGDPAGYALENDVTQHVMYRSANNHIHELWDDTIHGWRTQDLTAITGAAVAAGDPDVYVVEDRGTQHVMYRATGNHIHELWDDPTHGWRTQDLTAITGAVATAGGSTGYVFDGSNTQHVMYRGTDNHIHELWLDDGGWHNDDLSAVTGAPAAGSDPVGYGLTDQNSQHVMFRGADDHIHELTWE